MFNVAYFILMMNLIICSKLSSESWPGMYLLVDRAIKMLLSLILCSIQDYLFQSVELLFQ